MANLLAIHSVGESVRAYLDTSYPTDLRATYPCTFTVASSARLAGDAAAANAWSANAQIALFLYSVTINGDVRNSATNMLPGQAGAPRGPAPLTVDLHFLISASAPSATAEHVALAYAMQQLAAHPVFDAKSLTPDANWSATETVQLSPEPLTIADLTNLWTALGHAYRVSAAYVARGIRIEVDANTVHVPLLTRTLATTPGDQSV